MLCTNYKMETNNISIKDSLEYIDENLNDISDLDLNNLRIDKKMERFYCLLHLLYQ